MFKRTKNDNIIAEQKEDILRREQSMSKVNIHTKQRAWNKPRRLLESLMVEDLREAAKQEQKYHKINNPAELELLKSLS